MLAIANYHNYPASVAPSNSGRAHPDSLTLQPSLELLLGGRFFWTVFCHENMRGEQCQKSAKLVKHPQNHRGFPPNLFTTEASNVDSKNWYFQPPFWPQFQHQNHGFHQQQIGGDHWKKTWDWDGLSGPTSWQSIYGEGWGQMRLVGYPKIPLISFIHHMFSHWNCQYWRHPWWEKPKKT